MKTTHYSIPAPMTKKIAVLADFHSSCRKKQSSPEHIPSICRILADEAPDMMICPGDIFNHTDKYSIEESFNINGLKLLTEVRTIAPVYYSIGNHDRGMNTANRRRLEERGIVVLDDEMTDDGGICIGGLTTGYLRDKHEYKTPPSPKLGFIESFASSPMFKLLLCHHPEYWKRYICGSDIDLTVSGHAHGGQWGFFSRGVYAPGQGLLPKYVRGIHRNTAGDKTEYLAVSRGMTNTVPVPRFFNPCEIVILELGR